MEAVGNLAGGIAHDFNNILMVIRTSAALLERRLTDESARKDTQQIDKAAERAVDLTHRAIVVDRGQLSQVIMNLAVNARDAMPDGGTLTIRSAGATLDDAYVANHLDVAAGDYVVLQVTDSGQGMDEETREHIFDPSSRRRTPARGSGSQPFTGSSTKAAVTSGCTANPSSEQPSRSTSPSPSAGPRRRRPRKSSRSTGTRRSCSSRTRRSCGR